MVRSELEDKRTSLLGLLCEELNSREVHCDNVVWVVCMRVRQMCGTCAKEREELAESRVGFKYNSGEGDNAFLKKLVSGVNLSAAGSSCHVEGQNKDNELLPFWVRDISY